MSLAYQIQVDRASLQAAIDAFSFVEKETNSAIRIAINKTLPKIRTAVSKSIRSQVRLSASYVKDKLVLKKAVGNNLTGSISTPSRGLMLSYFSTDASVSGGSRTGVLTAKTPGGIKVKVKPKGPVKTLKKSFYVRLNGGQTIGIAVRLPGEHKKFKVLSGPSISQVFNTFRDELTSQAQVEFRTQMAGAMDYVLSKRHPPETSEE